MCPTRLRGRSEPDRPHRASYSTPQNDQCRPPGAVRTNRRVPTVAAAIGGGHGPGSPGTGRCVPRWHHEYPRPEGTVADLSAARTPAPQPRKPRISARIGGIAESATLAVDAKAKALKAAGPAGHRLRRRRTRLPDAGLHRRRPPPPRAPTPPTTATPRPPACRRCGRRSPRRRCATPAYEVAPEQVLITNGGKQAVYEAFATLLDPGDEVLLPAPYWTTYPEAIALAGGVSGAGRRRRDVGLPGQHRPAGGGADAAHQGAAVLLAVEPDRRGLPAGAGRGDRPVGGRAGDLGGHRRDLRAPDLRRRAARLDAGGRAGDRRPLHRA